MSFADNLQYLRKENKITQEELAADLDVSRQSVSKWETGEAYPETDKLIAICDKFGVTMDELVRGDLTAEKNSAQPAYPVQPQPVAPSQAAEAAGEERPNQSFLSKLATAISSAAMLVCVALYVCLGATLDIWSWGWVIILGGVVVCIWMGSFTDPKNKTVARRLGSAVCGSVMICAAIVFFLLGFLGGLWHPGWVSFLAGAAICSAVGAFMGKSK